MSAVKPLLNSENSLREIGTHPPSSESPLSGSVNSASPSISIYRASNLRRLFAAVEFIVESGSNRAKFGNETALEKKTTEGRELGQPEGSHRVETLFSASMAQHSEKSQVSGRSHRILRYFETIISSR